MKETFSTAHIQCESHSQTITSMIWLPALLLNSSLLVTHTCGFMFISSNAQSQGSFTQAPSSSLLLLCSEKRMCSTKFLLVFSWLYWGYRKLTHRLIKSFKKLFVQKVKVEESSQFMLIIRLVVMSFAVTWVFRCNKSCHCFSCCSISWFCCWSLTFLRWCCKWPLKCW